MIPSFVDEAGQTRSAAALGSRVASFGGVIAWWCERATASTTTLRSIIHRVAVSAAAAVFKEPECGEQRADPLTLANGFGLSPTITPNTLAVDPNFRPGYSQNWQVSVQRDIPAALVLTVTYLGSKGTHGSAGLPAEHVSGGRRQSLPVLSQRLHYLRRTAMPREKPDSFNCAAGCTTDSPRRCNTRMPKRSTTRRWAEGIREGSVIAQNWLDLSGERGLSNFDQRHHLNVQSVHHWHGAARRHAGEWLEGRTVQGMDRSEPDHRRQRSSADSVYLVAVRAQA